MNDISALMPDVKLRFHIEHPSFEESYSFGYDCAVNEVAEDENPYPVGSAAHEHWLEGWWAGFYGEEPLFGMTKSPSVAAEDAQEEAPSDYTQIITNVLTIAGAITVSVVIGYQIFDLVA